MVLEYCAATHLLKMQPDKFIHTWKSIPFSQKYQVVCRFIAYSLVRDRISDLQLLMGIYFERLSEDRRPQTQSEILAGFQRHELMIDLCTISRTTLNFLQNPDQITKWPLLYSAARNGNLQFIEQLYEDDDASELFTLVNILCVLLRFGRTQTAEKLVSSKSKNKTSLMVPIIQTDLETIKDLLKGPLPPLASKDREDAIRLTISKQDLALLDIFLNHPFGNFQSVVTLTFVGMSNDISTYLPLLLNLQTLSLGYCDISDDFGYCFTRLPSLCSIGILACRNLTEKIFDDLAALNKLTSFGWIRLEIPFSERIGNSLALMTSLRVLSLTCMTIHHPIGPFLQHLPNLEQLDLSHATWNHVGINSLTVLNQLTRLGLEPYFGIREKEFNRLKKQFRVRQTSSKRTKQ